MHEILQKHGVPPCAPTQVRIERAQGSEKAQGSENAQGGPSLSRLALDLNNVRTVPT
jgi:hypothetical protein